MRPITVIAILSSLVVWAGTVPARAQTERALNRGLSLQTPGVRPGGAPPACRDDSVVWLSESKPPTYVVEGDRFFGKGSAGRYLCRRDADRAGYRMTRSAP